MMVILQLNFHYLSTCIPSMHIQDKTTPTRTRKPSAPPTLPPKSPLIQQYQNIGRKTKSIGDFFPNMSPPVVPKRKQSRPSFSIDSTGDTDSRFSGGSIDETPTVTETLTSIQKTLSVLVEKVEKLEQNHSLLEQRFEKLETSKRKFDRPRKGKKSISSMNQVDVSIYIAS